ncbi:uncharacterized protein LOC110456205 [Mizuhopecten yessoensis]|uniref:uncharacterized protein LOC110456205 n=1 Tax=Mizuhopecten yessoensis TaxID=6573 RepID=UPI000B45A816|nr:uncharacterized protein LOC110456205 [Mizuhopecten yessoensis]
MINGHQSCKTNYTFKCNHVSVSGKCYVAYYLYPNNSGRPDRLVFLSSMMKYQKNELIFILITGIIATCLVNLSKGNCRPKTQLVAFDLANQVPKSPVGLQQCERECFSDKNCQLMVYNVNNLACYKVTNIGVNSITEGSDFVVKLRSDIASNLDTSYLCRNHQCKNGLSCVALSSGVLVCMAGLCGQPASITNAAVNANTYSISAIATYSCNNGYYSIGSSGITCNSSLEWSEANLVCCKDGFTYDQGTKMMYQVFSQNKIYDEALLHCSGLGSGLVKVDNTERMNVLSTYLSTGEFYIDATDLVTEGTWIFSDGSHVDMTLFGPGEPKGGRASNCAMFRSGPKNLDDVWCNTTGYFICEVR